jgi:nondiscriminating aspartyl-tRNA synthetase
MKGRVYINKVPRIPGTRAVVAGWVQRLKDIGGTKFIWLADTTGTIQLTLVKGKVSDAIFKEFGKLDLHDFVATSGKVPDKIIAKEYVELVPDALEVLSKAEKPLPLDVSGQIESELETRLNWRAISLRDPKKQAVLKIESKLVEGLQKYLSENNFTLTFTACLMGQPAEGGSEVFEVNYFDKKAYLRQDPQLHRQLLMVAGMDRIYDLGPSWRAELSHTPRHITEHRTCAAEMSFIDSEEDVMQIEGELVKSAMKYIVDHCGAELELLGKKLDVPRTPFPELRFPKVYDILVEMGKKDVGVGDEIDHESELLLAKYVTEKYKSDFFFLNRFPYKVKPFYVMRVDDDPEYARSADLIYKGIELSSGGQREHRYKKIIEQARDKKITPSKIEWFTKFFKYGAPPHGGFSIGLERWTMDLLDLPNITEAAPFARTPERLEP